MEIQTLKSTLMRTRIVFALFFFSLLIAASKMAMAQGLEHNPFAPKGNRVSPNGRYAWTFVNDAVVRYVLKDRQTGQVLTSIKSYYGPNEKFARAAGFFWNDLSSIVIVDELNYRRAGNFDAFSIQSGRASPIELISLVHPPSDANEYRLTTEQPWIDKAFVRLGWVNASTYVVRLALKRTNGNEDSLYYKLDFSDPQHPAATPWN